MKLLDSTTRFVLEESAFPLPLAEPCNQERKFIQQHQRDRNRQRRDDRVGDRRDDLGKHEHCKVEIAALPAQQVGGNDMEPHQTV